MDINNFSDDDLKQLMIKYKEKNHDMNSYIMKQRNEMNE